MANGLIGPDEGFPGINTTPTDPSVPTMSFQQAVDAVTPTVPGTIGTVVGNLAAPGLTIGQGLLSFNPIGFAAGLLANAIFGGNDEVAPGGFTVGQQTGSGISGGQVSGSGTATGGPTGLGINAYGQEVDPNAEAVAYSPATQMAMAIAADIAADAENAPGVTSVGLGSIGATTNSAGTTSVQGQAVDTGSAFGGDAVSDATDAVNSFAEAHGGEVGPGGDGGGGGGGGICTELHRQGRISDEVYASDHAIGLRMATEQPNVVSGYHLWAIPVVKLMQRSKLVTKVVEPFGKAWANEMHYQETGKGKSSTLGRLIISIGVPVCGAIGKLKRKEGLTVAPRVSI